MRGALAGLTALVACAAEVGPRDEGPVEAVACARLERMYAIRWGDRAVFGGLDGAAERPISVIDGGGERTIEPDSRGRFRVELPLAESIEVGVGDRRIAFRVRDPEAARAEAVRPARGPAGSVPNDLRFADDRGFELWLVRSGDHAVNVLGDGLSLEAARGLRLAAGGDERPPNPWFVHPAGAGLAFVSAFGQDRVLEVDVARGEVRASYEPGEVLLPATWPLSRPLDLDGNGRDEREVSRFRPRAPEAVLADDERLFAAFTGYVAPRAGPDRPPVFVPAVLVEWRRGAPLAPARSLVLPFLNPHHLSFAGEGSLLVAASGVLDREAGVHRATTEGGVVEVELESLRVASTWSLGDRAPGSALGVGDRVLVSSLIRAEVVELDPATGRLVATHALGGEGLDSVFRLAPLPDGLVLASSFNHDRVHAIDPVAGRVDPEPLLGPLVVGPGPPLMAGAQIVAVRPGRRGVDFVGPDVFVLAGLASSVVPVELRRLFGP